MSALPVIAILDAGKTNKKVFLFDDQYRIVYERSFRFEETVDEDHFPCENIDTLRLWVKEVLDELSHLKTFSIQAINFSSYGASLVHLNEQGNPFLPLYNYLKPYPENLKSAFFNKFGGEQHLSIVTASPVLGSLNSGMQLYRLKYEKDLLLEKGYSLHLPQYLSYLVTGKSYSDLTSIGCHTMLWDFRRGDYHQWVHEEKIYERLAPVLPSRQVIAAKLYGEDIPAGIGLHDSSAALIPYLSAFQQPFILISTGTWSISLNPFNKETLTAAELEQDCLSFLSYKGEPVKASRLFAGNEHERFTKVLASHFQKQTDYYENVDFSRDIMMHLEKHVVQSVNFHLTFGEFAFMRRDMSIFHTYEEAYHQLLMDIMYQQKISTSLLMKGEPVKRIFVDGGFGKNQVYMNLLAIAFPEVEVYAASVSQATAIGAALAIHQSWNERAIPAGMIDLKYYALQ